MPRMLPEGGLDPKYFVTYDEGREYEHRRDGEIEALSCYLLASTIHPEIPHAHFGAWSILEHLGGGLVTRVAQLRSAQHLFAASSEVMDALRLGTTLSDLRRHDEVVSVLEPLKERAATDAVLFGNLGTALRYIGRGQEALECYRHSIRLEPSAARRHFWLVNTLWELGRHDEAVAAFEHAPKGPGSAPPLETLARIAWSRVELGDLDAADAAVSGLEKVLYDAGDDHVGHTVGAGFVRAARARLAMAKGNSQALQSVQSEIRRHTPWLGHWLAARGWLDDLGAEAVSTPVLDPDEEFGWMMLEETGADGCGPLLQVIGLVEESAESDGDFDRQLAARAARVTAHARLGHADEATKALAQLEELEVPDGPEWASQLALLRWLVAFASEDAERLEAAAEEALSLRERWGPLMSAYAALVRGRPELVRGALAGLYSSLGRNRPGRVVVQDPLAPVYQANRNDPCPCGSGAKFKKCHGR